MRLLFLLPSVPEPPTSGARMRNRGLLGLAAAEHEVDVLAFGTLAEAERLTGIVRRVEVVTPPFTRSAPERVRSMLRTTQPDMAMRLWSLPFLARLQQLLATTSYDAVQAEGIEMARYLEGVRPRDPLDGRPWRIYDAHNAEFLLQRRFFESSFAEARQDPARLVAVSYSLVQWKRLANFERKVVQQARATLAVSIHDANQLEALALRQANLWVVPNAIDPQRIPFREPRADDVPDLLFLGTLGYRPNAEALRWLVDEVMPRLWQRKRGTRLFVVGIHPPAWAVAAGQRNERIVVVGEVPDETPYLRRVSALVLPMKVGGGSRLKALTAFTAGVPVVSTRLGMEGIDAEAGRDYLRADSTEEWVERLAALLGAPQERATLAENARSLVNARYTWSAVAPCLRDAYAALGRSAD